MARTPNGKCTGKAARIEAQDFRDSIEAPAYQTPEERIAALEEVKRGLMRNAIESPDFADSLVARADKTQETIDEIYSKLAYARLVKALGREKANAFIGREMLTCSWQEIRKALEMFADLAEKQEADADHADFLDLKATEASAQ